MAEHEQKQKPTEDGRRRSVARLEAVQALYEMAITGAPVTGVLEEFLAQRWQGAGSEGEEGQAPAPLAKPDIRFLGELVRGVTAKEQDLDRLIAGTLEKEGALERFEVLLRMILRAGAFELMDRSDIPPRVVINEYLDVTHAFFDDREAALVNGILDKLARTLRPREIPAKAGE